MHCFYKFLVLIAIIPLLSCHMNMSDLNSNEHGVSSSSESSVFLKNGKKIVCEARDITVACTAEAILLDQAFKNACESGGGHFRQCGKCQNTQACDIDVSSKFAYLSTGENIFCEDRDLTVLCPTVATLLDVEFKNACESEGGKFKSCGKCQQTQACNIDVSSKFAYDKNGTRIICEARDLSVACTAQATLLDVEFKNSCEARGGTSKRCGKCQDAQACSVSVQ